MGADLLLRILVAGTGATVCMDIWAYVQRHFLRVPSLDYSWVGRGCLWLLRGRVFHHTIITAPKLAGEKAVGWAIHYLTGMIFAFIPLSLAGPAWFYNPQPGVAMLSGILSLFAPFIIMQPAFGFGVAASKTPAPWKSRLMSLLTHLSFGIGLYLTSKGVAVILS